MNRKQPFSKPLKKQTLAEQVSDTVKESILEGAWQGGQALPTEPELAEQFGVSRTVIRDATRMLAAQGLVEAQHGRGVFVTASPLEAFAGALLLALRRQGATAWDVEQFEQLLFPELCALAGQEATGEEMAQLQRLVKSFLDLFRETITTHWDQPALPQAEQDRLRASFRAIYHAIAACTHNRLLQLLAQPLVSLRNLRNWEIPGQTLEEVIDQETAYMERMMKAIASRNPTATRRQVRDLMQLPPEAIQAMRQTPVGEIVEIKMGGSRG